jgi:hypothetical protein
LQQLPGRVKSSDPKYLEALDQTWEWVSRNIDTFEPRPHESIQKSLVKWINDYLIRRIQEIKQLSDTNSDTPSLSDLDEFE